MAINNLHFQIFKDYYFGLKDKMRFKGIAISAKKDKLR